MNVIDVLGVGKLGDINYWEHAPVTASMSHIAKARKSVWLLGRPCTSSTGRGCCTTLLTKVCSAKDRSPNLGEAGFTNTRKSTGAKILTQTHNIEGRCFSIHVESVIPQGTVDVQNIKKAALFWRTGGGFSEISGPDGSPVETLTKVAEHEEGLVIADLDLTKITQAKHWLDTVGHYSRPDLLWLGVDRREKSPVRPGGRDLVDNLAARRSMVMR